MEIPDQKTNIVVEVVNLEGSKALITKVGRLESEEVVEVPNGCLGKKGDEIILTEASKVSAYMELAGKCTICSFYGYPCDKTSRFVTIWG